MMPAMMISHTAALENRGVGLLVTSAQVGTAELSTSPLEPESAEPGKKKHKQAAAEGRE